MRFLALISIGALAAAVGVGSPAQDSPSEAVGESAGGPVRPPQTSARGPITEAPAENPAGKPAAPPAEQSAKEPGENPPGKLAEPPAKPTAKDASEQPAKPSAGDPRDDPGSASIRGGFSRDGERLRFHARNLDVAEALAQLRSLLRCNIVVSPGVSARFTGDLYDVTLEEAVAAICLSSGLEARFEGEFIYIEPATMRSVIYTLRRSSAAEVLPLLQPLLSAEGKVSVAGQRASSEEDALRFAGGTGGTPILVLDYPANQALVAATLSDLEGAASRESENRGDLINRVVRLRHLEAARVARMLRPVLSPEGVITVTPRVPVEGSTKEAKEAPVSGGVLLIRDHPKNVEAIEAVLAQIENGDEKDAPAESRTTSRVFHLNHVRGEDVLPLLQPLLSSSGKIAASVKAMQGIAPSQTAAGGDDFSQFDVIVVSDFKKNVESIASSLEQLDRRPRQVLLEATIVAVTLGEGMEFGVGLTGRDGMSMIDPLDSESVGATADLTRGTITPGAITPEQIASGIGLGSAAVGNWLSDDGLNLAFFRGDVGVLLRALAVKTEISVLATPKVTTLNKQRGEVLLGSRDGFKTETTSQTSTSQQIEYLETGTRLIYRPFVTSDGYVRLEIHPEDSDGGLTADGLPFSDTAEITTNVLVKDGDTVVIGGLFRERQSLEVRKLPLLGDIPFLGNLFRGEKKTVLREEIIVMLTPHILGGPGTDQAPASPVAGEAPRDVRRVAEAYVHRARELAAAGSAASASFLIDAVDSIGLPQDATVRLKEAVGREVSNLSDGGVIDEVLRRKTLSALRAQKGSARSEEDE